MRASGAMEYDSIRLGAALDRNLNRRLRVDDLNELCDLPIDGSGMPRCAFAGIE